ncbi:Type 1 glutamine amidotransferase-like domain-containing protein [Mycobacterium sp. E740]|uniref:Type 1 glutamine amidotransferase-like domain-containing protein n=1 Tax=Mycobacterium sp. E740 TaxID=1834149 RepID=UPI0007FF5113|nr:Type 1 glutamine amidotransferase-like domain-containing protein [Mycobacterium sp. E740]OBI80279.1 peptidase [Mycobacterium sp. E740]
MTETAAELQPLYLLADSQLLFWKQHDRLLLETAVADLGADTSVKAAYIGASNGDRLEYYGIFAAAVDALGVTERRMIDSSFDRDDRAFLQRANLIVLAGGDVRRGWNTFEETGMKDVILQRYAQGAILVGISAGAVQCGLYGIVDEPDSSATSLLDVFKLAPVVIDTHDERAGWTRLTRAVAQLEGMASGLGIPAGGGIVVHADATIEPLRYPVHEFRFEDARVTQSLLCPSEVPG